MALLKGNCHSILITGNLTKSNCLSLRLPFEDISSNLWQISINEIAQSYIKATNVLCGISCNFVTDIKYNSTRQIVNHHPILWQCVFKGAAGQKSVTRFDKTWFYITSAQEEINLNFTENIS